MVILRFMVLRHSFVGIGRFVLSPSVSGTAWFLMFYVIINYATIKLIQRWGIPGVEAMGELPR